MLKILIEIDESQAGRVCVKGATFAVRPITKKEIETSKMIEEFFDLCRGKPTELTRWYKDIED